MAIIKDYLTKLIKAGKREDDRGIDEFREIQVEKNPLTNACGSARVKIGKTDVIVGVMIDTGEPYPDSPDEGTLIVNAELSPLANSEFELGPPRGDAIELARVTDRMVRESGALDMEKLCIESGEKIWMVFLDIWPINADGNLFDAAALAAMVALTNAKFPKYDKKEDEVEYGKFSKKKVPIKTKPMMCTFGKIDDSVFLDPTEREEEVMDARLNVAITKDGHVHGMQKGGTGAFTKSEILKMVSLANKKGKDLRKYLK